MYKTLFALSVLTLLTAQARVYKGQKEYIKSCKECHNNGQEMTSSKVADSWIEMMNFEGKALADLHLKSKKAKASWSYFKSKKYRKKSKDLKDFMVEYAKDSGNIPACD
jgi:hypothetical protein